jgi:Domain of unknown function (DUF4864)
VSMSGSSPWRSSRLVPVLGLVAAMATSAAGAGVTEATAQPWVPSAPPQPSDLTPAPEPDESSRRAIDLVILSQWHALRAADAAASFAYASPRLREMYGTADSFLAMVQAGYQPIFAAVRFDFVRFVEFRGYLTREVRLGGPAGAEQEALYMITQLPDGSWRIAGCILMAPPAQS